MLQQKTQKALANIVVLNPSPHPHKTLTPTVPVQHCTSLLPPPSTFLKTLPRVRATNRCKVLNNAAPPSPSPLYGLQQKHREALKQLVLTAEAAGELWTRDWENMPLVLLSPGNPTPAAIAKRAAAALTSKHRWGPAPASAAPDAARKEAAARAALPGKRDWQETGGGSKWGKGRGGGKNQQPAKKVRFRKRSPSNSPSYSPSIPSTSSSSSSSGSDSDGDLARGVDQAEKERRMKRAGRFGDGLAKVEGGPPVGLVSAQGRARRKLLKKLAMETDVAEVDWDAYVIKVGTGGRADLRAVTHGVRGSVRVVVG